MSHGFQGFADLAQLRQQLLSEPEFKAATAQVVDVTTTYLNFLLGSLGIFDDSLKASVTKTVQKQLNNNPSGCYMLWWNAVADLLKNHDRRAYLAFLAESCGPFLYAEHAISHGRPEYRSLAVQQRQQRVRYLLSECPTLVKQLFIEVDFSTSDWREQAWQWLNEHGHDFEGSIVINDPITDVLSVTKKWQEDVSAAIMMRLTEKSNSTPKCTN